MSNRVGNPFPESSWAGDAYQNAGYLSVTMGYEWDNNSGKIKTQPRAWHNTGPVEGSPGDVLSNEMVIESIGNVPTERDRLDLSFILGYMQAQLDAKEKDG